MFQFTLLFFCQFFSIVSDPADRSSIKMVLNASFHQSVRFRNLCTGGGGGLEIHSPLYKLDRIRESHRPVQLKRN